MSRLDEQAIAESRAPLFRLACDLLCRTPPGELTAVSLTDRLRGGPGESAGLLTLSRCVAAEYELEARVRFDGDWFTVRFSRRSAVAEAKVRPPSIPLEGR